MIANKHITKIVGVIVAVAVMVCIIAMMSSRKLVETFGGTSVAMQYESELFDTDEVMHIDIQMDEEEWENMLDNALAEEYYSCDVVINDMKMYDVGIRPKGNTSLSAIERNPETDRFSLKLEFDHYVEGQNCYGLDKLILNNNYADATNMKEAVIYDMFQYLDADASLYNYAEISVNGEYWGVYLALEAVEDSFILRNYGTEDGVLYKPEGMNGGGNFDGADRRQGKQPFAEGDMPRMGMPPGDMPPDEMMPEEMPEGDMPSGDMPQRGMPNMGEMRGGKPSMGGNGADLNYTDDDPDSYSIIWEGEVTNTGDKDHLRVITALKNINEGTDLEEYLDIDNVLKYMAVHAFSVNLDSLSGNMAHNYYLYEYDGKLNILPWDYNLSFGGMNMGASGNAEQMINYAIDTPFQGTNFFDALLENDEYRSIYHEYLRQLTDEYVSGGKFEETYKRIRNQIDTLVETDPTALYTYEEYKAGAEMLDLTVRLRAESIQGQLDGTIPSTDEGQREDSSNLVDASGIDIGIMGRFDMGGGFPMNTQIDARGDDRIGMPGGRGRDFKRPETGDVTDVLRNDNDDSAIRGMITCALFLLAIVIASALASVYHRIPNKKRRITGT